jgi:hypothetical protein
VSAELSERYGTPRPHRRGLLLGAVALVAAAFLAWLAWAAWLSSTPQVTSGLTSYTVVDAHRTAAVIEVSIEDDAEATCRVRALAADHTVVGEVAFTPVDGRNEVSIRTEREATSVERLGCTTPDQRRPR